MPAVKEWGETTGRYIPPGSAPPQAGDMVLFDRAGDGVLDHIGTVTGVAADGAISTVEGNSSDGVSARRYGPGEYAGLVRLAPPGVWSGRRAPDAHPHSAARRAAPRSVRSRGPSPLDSGDDSPSRQSGDPGGAGPSSIRGEAWVSRAAFIAESAAALTGPRDLGCVRGAFSVRRPRAGRCR